MKRLRPNCADCGLGTIEAGEWYMVHDEIWLQAWALQFARGRRLLPGE